MTKLRSLWGAVLRNGPLLVLMWSALFTFDRLKRARLILAAQRRLLRNALRAEGSTNLTAMTKNARHVFDRLNLARELARIDHLGALGHLGDGRATRLDYAALLCSALLRAKKHFSGLPLGSKLCSYDGVPWTGLDVAQTWALLGSWGHLFGTFATERALHYEVIRDPELQRALLAAIDEKLRDAAEDLLRSRKLHKFFYVIGLLRLSTLETATLEERRTWGRIWITLYQVDSSHSQLVIVQRLFRALRKFAYLQLHAALGVPQGYGVVWPAERMIDEVIEHERRGGVGLYWKADNETAVSRLLSSIETLHFDKFFAGPLVAATVLQHLKQFRAWWRHRTAAMSGCEKVRLIASLHAPPVDWDDHANEEPSFEFSIRLKVPLPETDWFDEVRVWNRRAVWNSDADFVVSCPPGGSSLNVDIFAKRGLSSHQAHAAAERLGELCELSWSATDRARNHDLWRSIALLVCSVLEQSIDVWMYRLHLKPADVQGDGVGYATAGRDPRVLSDKVREIAGRMTEERGRELLAATELEAPWAPVADAVWVVLLGQLIVVNAHDGTEKTEVDIVIVRFCPDETVVWLGEVKHTKRGAGFGQAKTLCQIFSVDATPTSHRLPSAAKVAIASFALPCEWIEGNPGDTP